MPSSNKFERKPKSNVFHIRIGNSLDKIDLKDPAFLKILQQQYATKYLQSLGVQSTSKNIFKILKQYPIQNCQIIESRLNGGLCTDTITIMPKSYNEQNQNQKNQKQQVSTEMIQMLDLKRMGEKKYQSQNARQQAGNFSIYNNQPRGDESVIMDDSVMVGGGQNGKKIAGTNNTNTSNFRVKNNNPRTNSNAFLADKNLGDKSGANLLGNYDDMGFTKLKKNQTQQDNSTQNTAQGLKYLQSTQAFKVNVYMQICSLLIVQDEIVQRPANQATDQLKLAKYMQTAIQSQENTSQKSINSSRKSSSQNQDMMMQQKDTARPFSDEGLSQELLISSSDEHEGVYLMTQQSFQFSRLALKPLLPRAFFWGQFSFIAQQTRQKKDSLIEGNKMNQSRVAEERSNEHFSLEHYHSIQEEQGSAGSKMEQKFQKNLFQTQVGSIQELLTQIYKQCESKMNNFYQSISRFQEANYQSSDNDWSLLDQNQKQQTIQEGSKSSKTSSLSRSSDTSNQFRIASLNTGLFRQADHLTTGHLLQYWRQMQQSYQQSSIEALNEQIELGQDRWEVKQSLSIIQEDYQLQYLLFIQEYQEWVNQLQDFRQEFFPQGYKPLDFIKRRIIHQFIQSLTFNSRGRAMLNSSTGQFQLTQKPITQLKNKSIQQNETLDSSEITEDMRQVQGEHFSLYGLYSFKDYSKLISQYRKISWISVDSNHKMRS